MMPIFLGLGSNLGDRRKNLFDCLREFESDNRTEIRRLSSFYETEPFGETDQPRFYNAVAQIATDFDPVQLLDRIKEIEKKIGREKTYRWGPRKIDIDILAYGDVSLDLPDLVIPHPQLHLRRFALIPLKEIASRFFHPKLNKSIDEIIFKCQDKSQIRLIIKAAKLLADLK